MSPRSLAFIVREESRIYSNYRAEGALGSYLKKHNIPGLYGIDTRALVRHIREKGAMRGILSTIDLDDRKPDRKAAASPRFGWTRFGPRGDATRIDVPGTKGSMIGPTTEIGAAVDSRNGNAYRLHGLRDEVEHSSSLCIARQPGHDRSR